LIRIALIAPNAALRIGLRELLSADEGLNVLAEAGELNDLEAEDAEVDVLVLAPASAKPLNEELDSWPAVLLITDDAAEAQALQGSGVRAWGVLPSGASQEELTAAVRALAEGLWVGAPTLMRGLLRQPRRVELASGEALVEPLTRRETEVLEQMAQGLANKQIAAALGISEHTVKFHLSSLYAKLNVASRTEAVRAGLSRGLISL